MRVLPQSHTGSNSFRRSHPRSAGRKSGARGSQYFRAVRGRRCRIIQLLRDPFFRRFFELPDPDKIPPQMSAGSGVIVDVGKGYVITNHHVVDKATEIVVTLRDRRQFKAKLIAAIPQPTLRWCKSKLIG